MHPCVPTDYGLPLFHGYKATPTSLIPPQQTLVMLPNGIHHEITVSELLVKLHAAATTIGKDTLGFGTNNIGHWASFPP